MTIALSERLDSWSRYIDKELLTAVFLLVGMGLVMMTSASVAVADRSYGDIYYFFNRQVMFVGIGLMLALMVYQIRIGFWQDLGIKLLPIVLILLIVVLIPGVGKEVNGSRRWLSIAGFGIQISEMTKLIVLLYMAGYLVRHGKNLAHSDDYMPLLIPLIVLGVIGALLLLEPDFGTVVVIVATGLAMLFIGGVKLSRLALLMFGTVLIMIPLVMMGYRGDRMAAFLNPWDYATGKGYQIVHALMAVGDGGWFGAGLGGSVQKQFYLPEAHNDFIFAVLAEEFGFLGIVVTLLLFGWLVQRAFVIGFQADKAKLHYAAYVAYGIGFWMGFQVLFHIGVNLAVLPSKGLTLPFMSYGGSSLLITLIAMALLMRVYKETQIALFGISEPKRKGRKKPGRAAVRRKPKRKPARKLASERSTANG
jgi:cell division protein FtsW